MSEAPAVEFFFDVGSSYSYLAATQLDGLRERTGRPVRWRPLLLGGVFKASGNEMPASVPSKARYMLQDLQRWAEHYGVPFRFPSRFPLNTLKPQRALVAAAALAGHDAVPPLALGLFRAYWTDDRDVSSEEEIGRVAADVGLDSNAIVEALSTQQTKDSLRAATDEAVQRGVFGAPTFFVGEAMFWGNDRLCFVEAMLTGR